MEREICNSHCDQQLLVSNTSLRMLVIFAAFFFIIHGSWLFNFSATVDDVMLGDIDWIVLTQGRWFAWLFKMAFSHEPNYPYGGIFCGLSMAAAALLQCRTLKLGQTWQQVAYAVLLLGSYQEIDNIGWWMQNDTCAVGILTTSAAAYFLACGERRKWVYGVPLLTVSMGCYQTFGTYFLVLFLVVLLLQFLQGSTAEAKRLALRGTSVMLLALILYFAINKCMGLLAPESYIQRASRYQSGLTGWPQFFNQDSTGMFWMLVNYGVVQPLRRFCTLGGGHWLYLSTLVPVVWLAARFAWRKRYMNAIAITAIGTAVIYIPFLFAPLLLNHTGFAERMMNAVPVSTACLWALAFILKEGHFRRHAHIYGTILILVAVQALYLSGEAARNRMFLHERATEELHDMYMLARTEAVQHHLNDCDILFCGIVPALKPNPDGACFRCTTDAFEGEDSAIPSIFPRWQGTSNTFLKPYGTFLRIGKRMRFAKENELQQHSEKLHQMPIWPADGSVAADGDVVLVKLGNEMKEGVPIPAPQK